MGSFYRPPSTSNDYLEQQSCGKWPSTHRSVTFYAFAELSVPLYTHTLCLAIPYRLRPLSLPRSFSVREPKLEATYPKHYKESQFDTWLCQEELASLPTEG